MRIPVASTSSRLATRAKTTQAQLPSTKLRSLVSIYHQSADFITPETLDSAIDKAFIDDHDEWQAAINVREKDENDLYMELKARRALPKLSTGTESAGAEQPIDYDIWSSHSYERAIRLKAALYGVHTPATGKEAPKPGVEVLEEEHERIHRLLKPEGW